MKWTLRIAAIYVLLALVAAPCAATAIELRVGTEPSVTVLGDWAVSERLSLGISLGMVFGEAGQTPSLTLQTPSVTLAVHARMSFADPGAVVVPYLGVAGVGRIQGGQVAVSGQLSAGLRMRVMSGVQLLGEGVLAVPITGPGRTRFAVHAGIRITFR